MNRKYIPLTFVAAVLLATVAESAQAYVGPGAGISLLSALWALLAVIGSAILYIILWPFRRMRKRRKQARESKQAKEESPPLNQNVHPDKANGGDTKDNQP